MEGYEFKGVSTVAGRRKAVEFEGKWKGEVQAWQSAWYYYCTNIHPEELGKEFQDLIQLVNDHKKGSSRDYKWLSINPPPDVDKSEFEGLWQACMLKKWMPENVDYAFEYDEKERYHLHSVFHSRKKNSEIIREVYNTMKEILPNKACIHIRSVTKEDAESTIHGYIHKARASSEGRSPAEHPTQARRALGAEAFGGNAQAPSYCPGLVGNSAKVAKIKQFREIKFLD